MFKNMKLSMKISLGFALLIEMIKPMTTKRVLVCAMVGVLSWTALAEEQTLHKKEVAEISKLETPAISATVSACFISKYIWRGQLLNDDYVFQPSVGIGYGGLSVSLWGNMDITDYHDNNWEFTEYDWTAGYANTVPGVDFLKYSIGVIYYHFPSTTVSTMEVYGGLGLDVLLSPTVTLYRDVDEADASYVAFSVGHAIDKIFELSPDMPVGMTASASVGWGNKAYNQFYWSGLNEDALNDLTLTLGFPVPVLGWTITPSINYVTLLDSDVRTADTYATYNGNNDSDYLFTGITFSKSF